MPDLLPVSVIEMRLEAEREVKRRRKEYPRYVATGRLKLDRAERQIQVMEAIADLLKEMAK